MNILIENNETREYLTPSGTWSKDPLAGEVFSTTTAALRTVGQEAIEKFNIVFLDSRANRFLRLNYCLGTRTKDTGNQPATG